MLSVENVEDCVACSVLAFWRAEASGQASPSTDTAALCAFCGN
jgi:hypothetical protein